MPAFTTDQWAVLALVLVLGWLLGLMSRSGGAKWRRAYEEERARREAEQGRIAAANTRIAELERGGPVGIGAAGGIAAGASGRRDDLSLIRGVGHPRETILNDAGLHSYRDVETMSPADEAALEGRLGVAPGQIARDQWRDQAALLRNGNTDEHRARFA